MAKVYQELQNTLHDSVYIGMQESPKSIKVPIVDRVVVNFVVHVGNDVLDTGVEIFVAVI